MTTHINLPEQIHSAQMEAMKEENVKAENLGRLIKPIFKIRSDRIRYFDKLIWLPLFSGLVTDIIKRDNIQAKPDKTKHKTESMEKSKVNQSQQKSTPSKSKPSRKSSQKK
nr:putative reverse transcriptase domain-containing protein [Tanacetum cinerariifolium]